MKFGYGRVSTRDQDTGAQHDALLAAGVVEKNIFVEKISTRIRYRPELEAVRKVMRSGDELVVTKVDRLARSLLDLITIADELRAEGITLTVLSGTFNRDDPMGEAFFQMTGVFAQLERDLIRQRTLEGLAHAKKNGKVGGAKPKLSPAKAREVQRMFAAGRPAPEIAELFNISRASVYRYAGAAETA
jgi:DNA invertase Pin-like site-specific DNA recombinase